MRSKALLVGARAGFVGPWVNVEEGEWLVDPPSSVTLECGDTVHNSGESVAFNGPIRVRAIVDKAHVGLDIYLKVRQG